MITNINNYLLEFIYNIKLSFYKIYIFCLDFLINQSVDFISFLNTYGIVKTALGVFIGGLAAQLLTTFNTTIIVPLISQGISYFNIDLYNINFTLFKMKFQIGQLIIVIIQIIIAILIIFYISKLFQQDINVYISNLKSIKESLVNIK